MQRISDVMGALLGDLAPLMGFLTDSTWARRQGEPGISDFVAGNPHDPPLPAFVDAVTRWTQPQRDDWFAYRLGEQPARETIAASLRAQHDLAFEPEDVSLSTGTFGALSAALRAITDPGDEVIFVSPPWFFYEPMIRVSGATPVRVTSRPPAFDLPVDEIAGAITPRTRALIVNTPNNPTGRIYPPAALAALAGVLREASEAAGRTVYLLSDESYRHVLFDGNAFHSPVEHYADTMLLYTYGKTLLTPGERIGFIALPPTMAGREEVRGALLLSQIAGGWQFPNATLQYALPDLHGLSIDVSRLQDRRDRIVGALREIGYEVASPEATFYVLPRSPIADDGAFVDMLAEHDVFVLPGWAFELPGWFRISITANDDMVDRALPGFEKAFARATG